MDYPKLPSEVETLNEQLIHHFGIDTITGRAMWRISWSNDQYEKRLSDRTPEGLQLLYPEVQELRKYPWIRDRWILERLVLVPDCQLSELPTQKQSYECMWKFEDRYENALPPTFWAAKFVVDTVYAAMGKKSMAKYVDEEAKNPIEMKEQRINGLIEDLFGNETPVGDALAHHEGVGYTGPTKIKES